MTFTPESGAGLLIDTNLLVLFAVGSVNRGRIESFKRTRQYTIPDFELLLRVLGQWSSLYTVAHILAEVSNLTDLPGPEGRQVRELLKETISLLTEAEMPSARATRDPVYRNLGLVDAAIAAVAREHHCTVLTDDLDLYLMLERDEVQVVYFTYLRRLALGI
jgi:predicted nucleic acid-binding protein